MLDEVDELLRVGFVGGGSLLIVNHEHWRFSNRESVDIMGLSWTVVFLNFSPKSAFPFWLSSLVF